MLSADSHARLDVLARSFSEAKPFRHVVIDGFLESGSTNALLQQFPGFDRAYALNEMGEVGGKAVRTQVRELGTAYAALDAYIQGREFLDYVSRLTGIPDLLHDPDYEGGGTHENRDGQSLDPHVDFNYHPRTGWHRRLNLIVYLNPEWDAQWGGNLQLYRDPWNEGSERIAVAPLFNRCVVFETTESSWHGFDAIASPPGRAELSRKSFAIYLYTRERPAAETAPPHATVYVPEGMPADLAEGTVVDAVRLVDLRARFARLRAQLSFLYQRELDFNRQLQGLTQALEESRRAQRIDMLGYVRVHQVSGSWPDGWCARELRVDFTPVRAARGMRVRLWVPPQAAGPVTVGWRCAGGQGEVRVGAGNSAAFRLPVSLAADDAQVLELSASSAWRPAAPGEDGDQRELAYRLLDITLEH